MDLEATERLRGAPRTPLATTPTPLSRAPRLELSLGGGPEIWIKHDQLTGFGLGGNKVRKIEHELEPRRLAGVTHLITMGGPQSNHCRVTAAAAAALGRTCVLVINGDPEVPPRGNALLHRLYGAEIRHVARSEERAPAAHAIAEEIRSDGGVPLVVPIGASTRRGALGYARAAIELVEQLRSRGREDLPLHLFVASSSAGTLAGLAAGMSLLGARNVKLHGISADVPADELGATAEDIATEALTDLEADPPRVRAGLISTCDREIGDGYGLPTEASTAALSRFARLEGVLLDPTYTSKAAAALIRRVEEGAFASRDLIVFLHTGGHPSLLA